MIYLDNTTDNQTIFIDREMQSIENIKPISSDSNYYTKTEIDTEFLKVNNEIENITNRIDDLENDDKLSYVIDITNREGNILNREEALNIYNNFDTHKVIVRFEQEDTIYSMEIFNVIYDITGVRVEGILSDSIFAWEFADETITEVEPQITPLSAWVENYEMVYALATLNNKQTIENRDNITLLNQRITDIENNGDFLVISPVELGINENNVFKSPYTIGEWKNILNSNKTIILRMPIQANSMDNIEDSEVNYCERYIIGSDIFTGIQIIFKWYTLYFYLDSDDNYIPNIRLYKTDTARFESLIDALDERVTTLDENVTSLDERVTTLENNGANYYTKDEVIVMKVEVEDSIEKVKLKATPYTIRDDVNEILNLIRNGDATSNPFSVLSNGRNVLIRLKEDPNDYDIVCNVTSWFYNFRKGWFIFSYYSDVDKELKTIKYTYDENNIANELKREIL